MDWPVYLLLATSIVLAKARNGWVSEELIPEKEDESCPEGETIPCGSTINTNGTVLRYERGNLTFGNSSIPSKNCPWKIYGPPGTSILLETTCYHHFHVGNLTEYAVCQSVKTVYGDGSVYRTTSCGGSYVTRYSIPPNSIEFSVYYENGHNYALGFTTAVTFVGDPLPEKTSTSTLWEGKTSTSTPTFETTVASESTTSGAAHALGNFVVIVMMVQTTCRCML